MSLLEAKCDLTTNDVSRKITGSMWELGDGSDAAPRTGYGLRLFLGTEEGGTRVGLFSRNYEPGGQYHVRLTDEVFDQARSLLAKDPGLMERFEQVARESDCAQYQAKDFPVAEIIGVFFLGYELQEERDGVPQQLRIGNIELGYKDQVEYRKFVERFNAQIEARLQSRSTEGMGIGETLFSWAADAAVRGVKRAVTGKPEDVRDFERYFANYICGDSTKAKEYLLGFAIAFGGLDDGVTAVAKVIREEFWISEFAKYNRRRSA